MKTDIEIAQACQKKNIREIAKTVGIDEEYLELYGNYKAKVDYRMLRELDRPEGKLILVTAIGIANGSMGRKQTGGQQSAGDPANTSASGQAAAYSAATPEPNVPAAPTAVPSTPEPNMDIAVTSRLEAFLNYWMVNNQDAMLTLCAPSWASKQENTKTALFGLLQNRTPVDYELENISGTINDDNRTVTIASTMNPNNGKDNVRYRINVMMIKENDGMWYVDPQSLQSNNKADTPDPNITNTPAPTPTPAIYPDTVLYYNPSGGEYYHYDQNCKRINERYLPLQGHFKYSQINNDEYKKLKPCSICGAPSRP